MTCLKSYALHLLKDADVSLAKMSILEIFQYFNFTRLILKLCKFETSLPQFCGLGVIM
jgi:hypothetical protein